MPTKTWPLYQRLVIEGTIAGGDVFSFGMNTIWGPVPGIQISQADQQAALLTAACGAATGISGYVQTTLWGTATASLKPASVFTLTGCKFNAIGHDGKYVFPNSNEKIYSPSTIGGSAVGRSPRATMAVTLRANYQRGPASHGRCYPPIAQQVEAAGTAYVDSATTTSYATLYRDFIRAINGMALSGQALTVVNVSPGIDGGVITVSPVATVEVDRVIDTQRRRTNRVPRQSVAVSV
jgi:hypothetical protein